MRNNIWIMCIEKEYFYDNDKYYDVKIFANEKSAREYFEVFIQAMIMDLEKDYCDTFEGETFEDILNVELEKEVGCCSLYLEDEFYISIYLEEKEIIEFY